MPFVVGSTRRNPVPTPLASQSPSSPPSKVRLNGTETMPNSSGTDEQEALGSVTVRETVASTGSKPEAENVNTPS